jgi:Protein of unknown function (DUF3016)
MSRIAGRWLFLLMMPPVPVGALAASANVTFVHPENFTDIARYGDQQETTRISDEITRFIDQLAVRKLPADEALQIEVLDVDRAGMVEPWHWRPYDVRVMRSATWPSIKLRYRLVQGDRELASGEEAIADMNYLDHPNPYPTDDSLRYEKRMLAQWFQDRLVDRKKPAFTSR